MLSRAALLATIGSFLADYDETRPELSHVTWSESDLDSFILMAAQALALALPSKFTSVQALERQGDLYALPDGAADILEVVGVKLPDGRTIPARLIKTRRDRADIPMTSRAVCASAGRGNPGLYQLRQLVAGGTSVSIDPPPPDGAEVMAVVATVPVLRDDALDVPAQYGPVVFNWALAYAFGTEVESQSFMASSDRHWERGADLINLDRVSRERVRQRQRV